MGGVKPNPRDTLVYDGIKLCRESEVDFILAVGGAKEEDIPLLAEKQGVGDGRTWGFVRLSSDDITKIYEIAARALV